MGTKNNPGAFDCYANAEPDEPMFILLGRDPCTSSSINMWCDLRVQAGFNKEEDQQIIDARASARAAFKWALDKGKQEAVARVQAALEEA